MFDLYASLKVVLGPNKIMNIKNFKFFIYFCLQYGLSHAQFVSMFFDLSFLKIIPKMLFMGFHSAKYSCYFS